MMIPHTALPDDPIFSRLLQLATRRDGQVIVNDCSRGTQFGYGHILHGTLSLIQKLQRLLNRSTLDNRGGFYIAVLAPNGYEFIVAVLAALALGGVAVPMPTGALPAEAAHLLRQCGACCVLVGPEHVDLLTQIQNEVEIASLIISGQVNDVNKLLPVRSYTLDPGLAVPEDCPSILFYTSGTSGPPKGVLHARRTVNKYARLEEMGPNDDICIIPRGAFWSVYFTKLFQMLLTGVRVEIHNFGRNYDLIWEKLRERTGTGIVLSPTFWYGMMQFFQKHISKLPESVVNQYVEGARYLRDASATGAMPSSHVKQFWKDLRGGRPLKVQYGSTETQEISLCHEDSGSVEVRHAAGCASQGDLGTPFPNVTMKLSQGEEGEVLVKSPSLFLGYLNSPGSTASSLDSDGFFKTGDLAIRQNGRYIFKGRANMDLFKFYTYKVPRMEVESRLLALPYVAEGYIMPVADPQCDTRVAALVRPRGRHGKIDLGTVRGHLSRHLPAYQLPTVLRVLRADEAVPRTWSDKTAMRQAVEMFFPRDAEERLCGEATEVMDVSGFMKMETEKLWDLSGMR
ncbi:AMP-dependent synthetase/ligase [Metarhizium album ARSEF 1941]|uniref:AMP-dependent synthetase/ligase n=1 Tax=Metarhizium album (strain ARSEF 1941) TaxID=1081103 RepID=A0A0B2WU36_METAS|nr:AMP-dependent synthetase/ligase [Metarhizium album ARSEF 1941]KHN97578.1 AMP-dependent synthetase/ligase [Metarhizium album ARSEF 1941]